MSQPSAASRRTVAAPIPREPPLTIATRPGSWLNPVSLSPALNIDTTVMPGIVTSFLPQRLTEGECQVAAGRPKHFPSWIRVFWHSLNRGPATYGNPWFVAHIPACPDRAGRERARGDGGRGGGPGQVPRGRLRTAARDTRRLRILRGTAGRPGHRRHLQPAAELAARAVDAAGDRRREARAVREAVRVQRGRGGASGGRRRGQRPGRDGGHALPLPPADAAAERTRRRAGTGAASSVLDELRHRRPG